MNKADRHLYLDSIKRFLFAFCVFCGRNEHFLKVPPARRTPQTNFSLCPSVYFVDKNIRHGIPLNEFQFVPFCVFCGQKHPARHPP